MKVLERRSGLALQTIVTGMHLIPELGNSIDLIKKDGFPITEIIPLAPKNQSPAAWPQAMGQAMSNFAQAIEKLSPHIVLLFGDRAETFTCSLAASYMSVPSAHVQAGDKSGHVDDIARMAMAKLVNIHFASCDDSAERLRNLGEQEFRIFQVGAPQLDDIVGVNFKTNSITIGTDQFDLTQPYILLVQHSVLVERNDVSNHILQTLDAVLETQLPVYWIFPNSDPGYRDIISLSDRFTEERITVLRNIERQNYLRLLANCSVLVGNSSSGILEAPSFKVSVVNIGNRQRGRPQATNIINCGYNSHDIKNAIGRALSDEKFLEACKDSVNPYGDGQSSSRICKILSEISLNQQLIDKKTTF